MNWSDKKTLIRHNRLQLVLNYSYFLLNSFINDKLHFLTSKLFVLVISCLICNILKIPRCIFRTSAFSDSMEGCIFSTIPFNILNLNACFDKASDNALDSNRTYSSLSPRDSSTFTSESYKHWDIIKITHAALLIGHTRQGFGNYIYCITYLPTLHYYNIIQYLKL